MFKVDNIYITTPIIEILQVLKNDLEIRGIPLLNKITASNNNIQVTCPVHNNGQERKPSCGIRTTSNKGVEAGTVHCFTCGYRASLTEFISRCFGLIDNGNYGKRWIVRKFISVEISERPDLELNFNRYSENTKNVSYVSEEELDKLKQAARLEAYASYSEFVRRTALIEATRVIAENEKKENQTNG